ncbi:MAG: bifunctional methylenetetrahydrofolate dehydrogenase/methenyltetrahydrofolate cyclohydrolase FolD [Candidatus Latescibacterota bacterium]|nr:MAG: bifunctional methylenetetrahydrofolate dehydrogenase/methenyltetrahydrofolate cyclohydrolase FolD [Candidatus Latescibacterota bacterium]
MSARILDGKSVANAVLEEIGDEVTAAAAARPPSLAAVLVGDDPASRVYVRNKMKACDRCGIGSRLEQLPASASDAQVAEVLQRLNADDEVDGILLQLPLPAGIDSDALLRLLDPTKDVDGLHPVNLGKLVADDSSGFVPCTPAGIVELLRRYEIDLAGRRAVILGRSNLVGKPLALLLLRRAAVGNATVTVLHTRSRDIPERIREAEVVVAAAGSARFVQGAWLQPGATVIDVGIHRLPGGESGRARLVGDVDFAQAVEVAGAITPVPGGVGPMTVAMLMRNTALAWRRKRLA